MKSVNECLDYAENSAMDKELITDFIRNVMVDNVSKVREFIISEEYTGLAKETHDRIKLMTEDELKRYKVELMQEIEYIEHNEDISQSVLIKTINMELFFKDIEDLIKQSYE